MNDGITPDAPRPATDGRFTDAPPPQPPAHQEPPSRKAQWVVAAVLGAGLIFAAVFAMNYLPSMGVSHDSGPPVRDLGEDRVLTFSSRVGFPVETEVGVSSYQDYWFTNKNDKGVVIGLKSKGCICSSIEAYVLPEGRRAEMEAAMACLAVFADPAVAAVAGLPLALAPAWRDGEKFPGAAIMKRGEKAGPDDQKLSQYEVPAGATGFVRLRWKGEHVGQQKLEIGLWQNDPDKGPGALLTHVGINHEPIRFRNTLAVGTLRDADLAGDGAKRQVIVWSSTRRKFDLDVRAIPILGGGPDSDPFVVETPVPLTESELAELERRNFADKPPPDFDPRGRVQSGYRITLAFRGTSKDGKVPFTVGAFRRTVELKCVMPADPADLGKADAATKEWVKGVSVRGRVVGLVEMGGDDEGVELIDFRSFPRRAGATATPLTMTTSVPGLKLEFDRSRTPAYLDAKVEGPTELSKTRWSWRLTAAAVKGKASGSFPRAEDPLYDDSAIYLRALVPAGAGREAQTRSIRVAARGNANES